MLSAGLVPVMAYESDVPRYPLRWFLPVAAAGLVLACRLIERVRSGTVGRDPRRGGGHRAALAMVAVSWSLGHSTPLVPPVLIGAVLLELARGRLPLWCTAVLARPGSNRLPAMAAPRRCGVGASRVAAAGLA